MSVTRYVTPQILDTTRVELASCCIHPQILDEYATLPVHKSWNFSSLGLIAHDVCKCNCANNHLFAFAQSKQRLLSLCPSSRAQALWKAFPQAQSCRVLLLSALPFPQCMQARSFGAVTRRAWPSERVSSFFTLGLVSQSAKKIIIRTN